MDHKYRLCITLYYTKDEKNVRVLTINKVKNYTVIENVFTNNSIKTSPNLSHDALLKCSVLKSSGFDATC